MRPRDGSTSVCARGAPDGVEAPADGRAPRPPAQGSRRRGQQRHGRNTARSRRARGWTLARTRGATSLVAKETGPLAGAAGGRERLAAGAAGGRRRVTNVESLVPATLLRPVCPVGSPRGVCTPSSRRPPGGAVQVSVTTERHSAPHAAVGCCPALEMEGTPTPAAPWRTSGTVCRVTYTSHERTHAVGVHSREDQEPSESGTGRGGARGGGRVACDEGGLSSGRRHVRMMAVAATASRVCLAAARCPVTVTTASEGTGGGRGGGWGASPASPTSGLSAFHSEPRAGARVTETARSRRGGARRGQEGG